MNAGALTEGVYYILLSLLEPRHGYGIMQYVSELSSNRVNLAAGTLYGALNSMMDKEWITLLPEEEESRKKEYQVTALGRDVLLGEIQRLQELVTNGQAHMEVNHETR